MSGAGPRRGKDAPTAPPRSPLPEHHHRSVQGGTARAAIFGVSDGLVSNVALILGVAGAAPGPGVVRLAGIAGLLAGAFSMAAGEYVSMQAQRELLEREIARERAELRRAPMGEAAELAQLYRSRGVAPETANAMAEEIHRDPELALEIHVREELGVDPDELGNPVAAAAASFVAFAGGAFVPLLPWFFSDGTPAVLVSMVLAAVAAAIVGGVLARFTGRSAWASSARQVMIAAGAAGVTYAIGTALDVSVP